MIYKTTWLFSCLLLLISVQSRAVDRHVYAGNSIQTQINSSASGDKVIVHAGTYAQAVTIISKSNFTLQSAGDGEVILAGDGSATNTIYVQNGSNITISNLTIKNSRKAAWSTGITIEGSGSGFTITGNKITDISYVNKAWDASDNPGNDNKVGANGILIAGTTESASLSNINVLNNEVSYCITGWSEALSLKGNINTFDIEGNTVHDITNIGIDVLGLSQYPNLTTNNQPTNGTIKNNTIYNCICNYTDNGAIYLDGAMNTLICNNKVYKNKYGITLGCENQINKANATASGLHIRNNLIYNNSKAGIMCGSNGVNNGSTTGMVSYSSITGNTLIKNASSDQYGSEIVIQYANNIDCFSNILYGRYTQMLTLATGASTLNFRANCYYNIASSTQFWVSRETSPGTWTSIDLPTFKSLTNDSGSDQSALKNPMITSDNENSPDPHLTASSPCINTGKIGFSPFTGEKDYDGQDRVAGGRVDVGVDESGSGGGAPACTVITVDGSLSDWNSISAIKTATSQTAESLKAANNTQTLYVAVSGCNMDATQYQIFLNTDNNTATGYNDNAYTSSGADYLIENGVLYKYNGSGWSWTAVSATIQVVKNASVTELGVNRSAFTSLSATIKVAYKDMTNYVTQSKLPASGTYASYSIVNCQ